MRFSRGEHGEADFIPAQGGRALMARGIMQKLSATPRESRQCRPYLAWPQGLTVLKDWRGPCTCRLTSQKPVLAAWAPLSTSRLHSQLPAGACFELSTPATTLPFSLTTTALFPAPTSSSSPLESYFSVRPLFICWDRYDSACTMCAIHLAAEPVNERMHRDLMIEAVTIG